MWGLVKSALLGLLDRLPGGDPLLDEEDEEDDAFDRGEVRVLDYGELGPRSPSGPPDAANEEPMEDQA
jgi:hypothetical protein